MSQLYDVEEEKKYVYQKEIECGNCGKKFQDIRVKNTKLRRQEPDRDLRPRFKNIDTLKYGITACPYCGYAASQKNFGHLTKLQRKLLSDNVSAMFVRREIGYEYYDYETAIDRYKLALVTTIATNAKLSAQAYLCLQLSWLIRGQIEEAEAEEPCTLTEEKKQQLLAEEDKFYRQAYDGLTKAEMQEDFPICGMDSSTYDYLLAVMSFRYEEYELAIRYCGKVVQEKGVSSRLKDRALMLKDEILDAKKDAEGEE